MWPGSGFLGRYRTRSGFRTVRVTRWTRQVNPVLGFPGSETTSVVARGIVIDVPFAFGPTRLIPLADAALATSKIANAETAATWIRRIGRTLATVERGPGERMDPAMELEQEAAGGDEPLRGRGGGAAGWGE